MTFTEIFIISLLINLVLCVYTIFILLKDIRGMKKVIERQRRQYEMAKQFSIEKEKREMTNV